MALAAFPFTSGGSVVVDSLIIDAPIVCVCFVLYLVINLLCNTF